MICATPGCGADTGGRFIDLCPACWKLLSDEEQGVIRMAIESPTWPKTDAARSIEPGAAPNDGALVYRIEIDATTAACAKSAWKRRARAAAKRRAKKPRSWMRG